MAYYVVASFLTAGQFYWIQTEPKEPKLVWWAMGTGATILGWLAAIWLADQPAVQ